MIIITGAAGFIASNLLTKLNNEGFRDIILVDDFSKKEKQQNYINKKYTELINRNDFFDWLQKNEKFVQFIFHLGARTDTTELDNSIFEELNLNYSKKIWNACVKYGLPLIYASSAATYGLGEFGYDDNTDIINKLKPLNPYGKSKNDFDIWASEQNEKPYFWAGIKFFNVYGPNEYHKNRMASVVFHSYNQIKKTGEINLFKSHNTNYKNGEQKRDFIYVKDVVDVLYFMMNNRKNSGLYNLGTGKAQTFLDLANNVFKSLNINPKINFIDTPEDIRSKYQYFTQANIKKLRNIGYNKKFYTLDEGVSDYVKNYLSTNFYN